MMLSFKLTEQLKSRFREIANVFSIKFSELQNMSLLEKESISRYVRISQIGASTRIENAVFN